jgi:uncharacterized surface protein with fasciclin (FAS1) repeats
VRRLRSNRAAVVSAALAVVLTGCSGGGDSTATPGTIPPPATMAAGASEPFGPACSSVPAEGAGSFSGMATAPLATAASNNPVLSSLVSAVKQAGLGNTLNTTQDLTVFAPANDAFRAVPRATMDAARKDPKGLLTSILTGHVVAGRLAPGALAGAHQTLAGTTITVEGSGEDFTVNGNAKVVCGNVQTANATVYIIDNVLLPQR